MGHWEHVGDGSHLDLEQQGEDWKATAALALEWSVKT